MLRNCLEHLFSRTYANGCFCTSNHKVSKVLGICRPSLLNQKRDVGWFVDLLTLVSLKLIISRNYSNAFIIDLKKTKTKPKQIIAASAVSSDIRILTV